MIDPSNNLSPEGKRRREAILDVAIRHATNRRYNRIERRLGAVLVIALVATGMLLVRNTTLVDHHGEIATHVQKQQIEPKTSGLKPAAQAKIQIVRTDPNIVERLSVKPQTPRWKQIGDDELLATLSESGKPAGIVEINGKSRIVYR